MKKFISPRYEHWAEKKQSQLKNLPAYFVGFFLRFFSHLLHLHPKTLLYVKKSLELGNPGKSVWPNETLPMISRLLSGGMWNWSFFQFHRNFHFPYWAHRQYNPQDRSFIPRSHNILSINQTHRNWLSISFPGKPGEVSVDPSGAVMCYRDGFTIELACIENGKLLRCGINSALPKISLLNSYSLQISWLKRTLYVCANPQGIRLYGKGDKHLILGVRPFNMEGASFLNHLQFHKNRLWYDASIEMKKTPQAFQLGSIHRGDSLQQMTTLYYLKRNAQNKNERFSLRKKFKNYLQKQVRDMSGLANASFLYSRSQEIDWQVQDLHPWQIPKRLLGGLNKNKNPLLPQQILKAWFPHLTSLRLPSPLDKVFFHAREHLLTLWDFDSITPGSFTYHHFWIRDAVFMLHALLFTGGQKAVREILLTFPAQISWRGAFRSQAGEWDANGQALWIVGKYINLSGDHELLQTLRPHLQKLLLWIKKILEKNNGLMPIGFSAEHLGTSDIYLWDNFWTLGGLQAMKTYKNYFPKVDIEKLYNQLLHNIEAKLKDYAYYPAAFGRRKDAGMIGSLSPIYPLQLDEFFNKRMKKTLKIIYKNYFFRGCFYQENIHSGINPYLSLQAAETFLHMGETQKAYTILENVLKWKSIGYTFPEAVHPRSKGGCMGDGFHGWAFAELVILLKNFLVWEIQDCIVLFTFFPEAWKKQNLAAQSLPSRCGEIFLSYANLQVNLEIKAKDNSFAFCRFFTFVPSWAKEIAAVEGIEKIETVNNKVADKKTKNKTHRKEKKIPRALAFFSEQRLIEIFPQGHLVCAPKKLVYKIIE